MSAYYDLKNPAGVAVLDKRPETDPDTLGKVITYRLQQRYAEYNAARVGGADPEPLSTTDEEGAFLVAKTPGRDIGGGMVEWTQRYRHLPPARTIPESYTHSYQFLAGGTTAQILEIPLTVTSHLTLEYEHIILPAYIGLPGFPAAADGAIAFYLGSATMEVSLAKAYRVALLGTTPYFIGSQALDTEDWILAEDQSLELVEGNIYRRKTRRVPSWSPALLT